MNISKLQVLYGLTAIVGLVVTWYFNLQPRETSFLADIYINSASTSISNDLFVVVFTFVVWSFVETRRLKMSYLMWIAIIIYSLVIAAASGVPIFMLLRERRLTSMENAA